MMFDPERLHKINFEESICGINTPDDVLVEQLKVNIRRGLPQAKPYAINNNTVLMLAGGPSLASTKDELRAAVDEGGKIVALNGAYQWCIDNGFRPSAFVMLDAREFNSRFVGTPVDGCQYLIGSECHPSAFEKCRGRQVTIWHQLSSGDRAVAVLDDYYLGRDNYFPVCLGTTITMRAISLMRMLGFVRFDIFGLDSCYLGGEHHAYRQAENDAEEVLSVWLRHEGRDDLAQNFRCAAWQVKQAQDFMELIAERGDLFELNVRGPGLIATMMRLGAQIEIEENGLETE